MIISWAFAQGAAPAGQPDMGLFGNPLFLLPVMLLLMYFLIFRPQMKRAKETKAMIDSLQKGDEVVTAGGIVGKISKMGDQYVSLEIAPNTEISVQKAAVQMMLPKGTLKSLQ